MKTLSENSKRFAFPFFYHIEKFAREHEAQRARVLLLIHTHKIRGR